MKKFLNWPPLIISLIIFVFFWKVFIRGLTPIPADTVMGMYHPWRDSLASVYPRGMPFKNFLLTDPVRQQFPWRFLAIEQLRQGKIPLWNPYSFAGTPLLANFQSGVFYPLNFFFLVFSFNTAWGLLIIVQPLLAALFTYFYLRVIRLSNISSFLGALTFAFCGFSISWMEWGTIVHTALWLPLVLAAIEKIIVGKRRLRWVLVFTLSLTFSFFAGHLQTFFYLFLFSLIYLLWRTRKIKLVAISYLLLAIVTALQWWPTGKFIGLSGRTLDQLGWQRQGWFLPWQHLIQFAAPDFFGNPSTLNYWGEWNYGEFIGFIGIISLIFAFMGMFRKNSKHSLFFSASLLVTLLFCLPTFLAKLPYIWQLPFLSTSQPTRLMFLVDFSLAILAALGFEKFVKGKIKRWPPVFLGIIFLFLWSIVMVKPPILTQADWLVAKRNLLLPSGIFLVGGFLLLVSNFKKNLAIGGLLALITFDLMRFGWKYLPFSENEWIFPPTKTTEFLQNNLGEYRYMTTDSRISPPNFNLVYKLNSSDGYDPLYLKRYGELIAASERGKPDIAPPFGFNRIITPQNFESRIVDLLGVKYVLSLKQESSSKLSLVFQEGETRVYENRQTLPRAFMVYDYQQAGTDQEIIDRLFDPKIDLGKTVVLEEDVNLANVLPSGQGSVKIAEYQPDRVEIEVVSDSPGVLLLTDAFYPGWKVKVDGVLGKILRADYHFRAVYLSEGNHQVVFWL